jgi:hypothetical protein
MDILKTKSGGDWAPSSERVLATTSLAGGPSGVEEGTPAQPPSPTAVARPGVQPLPPLAPPPARPVGRAAEPSVVAATPARPAGFGPPRRPVSPGSPPVLSPADLEALERLARKESSEGADAEPGSVDRRRRPPGIPERDVEADEPRTPAPAAGRKAETKTLAEILAELDGADVRLPPAVPAARPRRGPVSFAAPKPPAAGSPVAPAPTARVPIPAPPAAPVPAPPVPAPPVPAAPLAATPVAAAAPAAPPPAAAPAAPPPAAAAAVGGEGAPVGFGSSPPARPARPARGRVVFAPAGPIAPAQAAPPAIAPDQPEGDFSDAATAMSVSALLELISGAPSTPEPQAETATDPDADHGGGEPDSPAITTWWPPAEAGVVRRPEPIPKKDGLGPVPSKYRPTPGQKSAGRRLLAGLLVVAFLAVVAGTYLVVRRELTKSAPNPWDPRVAALARFVQSDSAMTWGHPVAVRFLTPGEFSSEASGKSARPGPVGTNVALWVPDAKAVYVDGTSVDIYTDVALVGQLTEAIAAQHPGRFPGAQVGAEAERVQAAYVRSLSPSEQITLHREQRAGH